MYIKDMDMIQEFYILNILEDDGSIYGVDFLKKKRTSTNENGRILKEKDKKSIFLKVF